MTRTTIPAPGSRSHALLMAMIKQGSGTYYQICERANFDLDNGRLAASLRKIFDHMIGGNVRLTGIIYSLTPEARIALGEAPPAPYVGQVAGAAYRGPNCATPVTILRRDAGVRA